MKDAVAFIILVTWLTMLGFGQKGCNFQGPGLHYTIDGQGHYFKIVGESYGPSK